MANYQKLLSNKKVWIVFIAVLFGIFCTGYLLFFTTPQPTLKTQPSSGSVQIIGSPADYSKSITSLPPGVLKLAGSKELCWTPPECEKIVQREKEKGPINLNLLSDAEKKCLYECLPPPNSPWAGERETIRLSLTGDQLAQIITPHLSQKYKTKNVFIKIDNGVLSFQGVSRYPLLPGKIAGELLYENNRYKLKTLYIGQIPVPQEMQASVEMNLDSIITNSLVAYGISMASIKIENDNLEIVIGTPRGLVTVNGKNIIINFELLPTPAPTTLEDNGEYTIQ